MGSYTLELRELIEQATQFEEMSHTERIVKGRGNLFNFQYPIFDESYRNVFETNFIREFYMREIGFETEGLFKFRLETWLNINMPYYNKLFESELIEFNPLESYNLKTKYQKVNDTKQDGQKNYTQNDLKNVDQNNIENKQFKENEVFNQSDLINKTQNDSELITTLDRKDVSVDDNTKINRNSTNEMTVDDTVNQTSKVDENNENVNKSTLDGRTEVFTIDNEKNKNFNRKLESNTPDSRLAITTQDGKGVIEYASKIDENVDDNLRILEGKNTNKQDDKKDDLLKETKLQNGQSDTISNNKSNGSSADEEDSTYRSNLDETINGTSDKSYDMTGQDKLNRDTNADKTGNQSLDLKSTIVDTFNTTHEDKTTNKINDIEDYIESKVGSIGVKTYSEMIKEYRSILLRIEKDIFNEMNELFMLVY